MSEEAQIVFRPRLLSRIIHLIFAMDFARVSTTFDDSMTMTGQKTGQIFWPNLTPGGSPGVFWEWGGGHILVSAPSNIS